MLLWAGIWRPGGWQLEPCDSGKGETKRGKYVLLRCLTSTFLALSKLFLKGEDVNGQ